MKSIGSLLERLGRSSVEQQAQLLEQNVEFVTEMEMDLPLERIFSLLDDYLTLPLDSSFASIDPMIACRGAAAIAMLHKLVSFIDRENNDVIVHWMMKLAAWSQSNAPWHSKTCQDRARRVMNEWTQCLDDWMRMNAGFVLTQLRHYFDERKVEPVIDSDDEDDQVSHPISDIPMWQRQVEVPFVLLWCTEHLLEPDRWQSLWRPMWLRVLDASSVPLKHTALDAFAILLNRLLPADKRLLSQLLEKSLDICLVFRDDVVLVNKAFELRHQLCPFDERTLIQMDRICKPLPVDQFMHTLLDRLIMETKPELIPIYWHHVALLIQQMKDRLALHLKMFIPILAEALTMQSSVRSQVMDIVEQLPLILPWSRLHAHRSQLVVALLDVVDLAPTDQARNLLQLWIEKPCKENVFCVPCAADLKSLAPFR